ncbi:NosD domain-containing protein [uncultured Anaerotruncus sp.]|uniref:beta strand repeat-containing protein n=1 Tax=uncultured Anaerotruncus sp. TaxID=905011 RepID=UPI00280B0C0C|nr:NosD domain-containing protein [uncultured Anaerotruncus sp.]
MSADGVYTVKAFRGENLLTAAVFAAPANAATESSLSTVYWNPDPTFTDVDSNIPGGGDNASGESINAPVKSFERALWLVQPNGTIICMSQCSDTYYGDGNTGNYAFDGKNATVKRWGRYPSGAIFDVSTGINLELSNLTLSNDFENGGAPTTDSVVSLAGGTLTAGAGLALGGPVYFEQRPESAGILFTQPPDAPYAVKFAPGAGGFTSAFDAANTGAVMTAETIGNYLTLDASVNASANPKWALRIKPGTGNEQIIQAYPIVAYTAVYLSGSGDDANDGATVNTPVATFARAKELLLTELGGDGIIYICGTTVPVAGNETWSLSASEGFKNTAKVRNYSGFSSSTPMIHATGSLTLTDITAEGSVILRVGEKTAGNTASLTIGDGANINYTGTGGTTSMISLYGGKTVMNGGTLTGNGNKGYGVSLESNAIFEVSAGTVGGFNYGVYNAGSAVISGTAKMTDNTTGVYTTGKLTLRDTTISGSKYGVNVAGGNFEMESGAVNTSSVSSLECAVNLSGSSSKFTMTGGTVSAGVASSRAVQVGSGIFTMTGGSVLGRSSYGVYLSGTSATFNLAGGTVSKDDAETGAAIYVTSPNFTLNGAAATVNGRINLTDPDNSIKLSGVPTAEKKFDILVGYYHSSGTSIVVPASPLTDVSGYEKNFVLKNLTDKFTIGGYKKDLILLEIGIYLDGVDGNDNNTGLSPAQAVKTFGAAKEKLVTLAGEQKENTSFKPHIFLCGTVTVSTNEGTWDLGEVNALKTGWKADIRRFTNNNFAPDTLVRVASGGNLTLSNIVVDGLRDVTPGLYSTLDLFRMTGGTMTFGTGTTLSGAARSAALISGGRLTIEDGVVFTGNGNSSQNETAVIIVEGSGSAVTMNGGEFDKNKAMDVILARNGATFNQNGGKIGNGSGIAAHGIHTAGDGVTINMTGGEVFGFNNGGNFGGGVWLDNGAVFNMSGGEITGNGTGSSSNGRGGGGVYVKGGATFNISGEAVIRGNSASYGVGGGVYLDSGASFSMTGGHIRGNTAAEAGSEAIYSVNAKEFELGGEIDISGGIMLWDYGTSHDTPPITLTGPLSQRTPPTGLAAESVIKLTLSEYYLGETVVAGGESYNAGQYLNAGGIQFVLTDETAKTMRLITNPLEGGTPSDIVAAGWNVYISGTGTDAEGYGWGPKKPVRTFGYAKNLIKTVQDIPAEAEANILVCGTVNVTTSENSGTWTLNDISVGGRTPVLRRMRSFTNTMVSMTGGTLTLQNITIDGNAAAGSSSSYLVNQSGGTLNVTDGALLQNNGTYTNSAGIRITNSGAMFSMTEGEVSENDYGISITGGANAVLSGGTVSNNRVGVSLSGGSLRQETGSIITANRGYGFSVTGGTATLNGGEISYNKDSGIYVSSGTVNLNGSKICNNEAKNGAGVYLSSSGQVSMTVGEITQNTASGNGGGVYLYSSTSKFTMSGGKIGGNTAKNGGGVYSSGSFTLDGGKINGNVISGSRPSGGIQSDYNGGGVYQQGGSFAMTNGEISGNRATGFGGGFYQYYGTFTMSGGVIKENNANDNGGGVFTDKNSRGSSNFTMTGGEISRNTAYCGGGVSVGGNFDFSNGKIIDNSAQGGGGLLVSGTVTMTGGEISNNQASRGYGGIYQLSGTVTMDGGKISGNTSKEGSGGGLYLQQGTFTLNGGAISGNSTPEGGGGVYSYGSFRMNGGEITGNTAAQGAGCYCYRSSDKTTFSGGRVSGNILTNETTSKGRGVYVETENFILEGGGADLSDGIYLSSRSYPIKLSKTIRQAGRRYNVELLPASSTNGFKVGDVVVKREGTLESAAPNLRYFATDYEGAVLDRGSGANATSIVLKKIIFVDGVKGNDSTGDGSTPDLAYKTFAAAKAALGGDPGNIYICGTLTVSANDTWSLGADQALRRYSGFAVAGKYSYTPFRGDMIEVKGGTLTLSNITIEGRHDADQGFTANGSIIKVNGGKVAMNAGTTLANNTTTGNGGAVNIAAGSFGMFRGSIVNTQAAKGDAIYQNDLLTISEDVEKVEGDIYLTGKGTPETSKFISAYIYDEIDGPLLTVSMEDPYGGRTVVDGRAPQNDGMKAKYTLAPEVLAQYKLGTRSGNNKILELQEKGIVYIDGVDGLDTNSGTTPDEPVLTLKRAYELLGEGGVIYVVDNVAVTGSVTLNGQSYSDGSNTVDAGGPVVIRRYSVPTNPPAIGFTSDKAKRSYTGMLFTVNSGGFIVSGVTIDGHSAALTGSQKTTAPAVAAQAPLIGVTVNGTLIVGDGAALQNNNNIDTGGIVFGGAVFNAGNFRMTGGAIANTAAERGAAIYQRGSFYVSGSPSIAGEIYLAIGTTMGGNQDKKIIDAEDDFAPANPLLVNMDGAENGRNVVRYGDFIKDADLSKRLADYTLADEIAALYTLGRKDTDNHFLELQAKSAVYINGQAGDDTKDGTTPANAVRTLKVAFDKLKTYNGGTLYVVDTVDVSSARITVVTDEEGVVTADYSGEGGGVTVAGEVLIKRYAQPSNIVGLTGFGIAGNESALFNVIGNLTLDGVTVDGHSRAVTSGKQEIVAAGVVAKAPLITVAAGGTLTTDNGVRLQNNSNTATDGTGGAVANNGTFRMEGGVIAGNDAQYGAGVWQNGAFRLGANSPSLGADQTTYLTDGADHRTENVIHVDSPLGDGAKISVDMDRTEPTAGVYAAGRNVAVFADGAASYNDVANDAAHFVLADSIVETFALVKSPDENNTLELGLPFHFTTKPDDAFVRVGDKVTFTAAVSTSAAADVKLYDKNGAEMATAIRDDEMAEELAFRAVVRSNNADTSTVSFTFQPEAGSRAGEYYLTAADANGVTAKSEKFILSLYEADMLTAKATGAAEADPNSSTGYLKVYNGYDTAKNVTSNGVALSEGLSTMLGLDDTPTLSFATEQEINANFKLWTADDAMHKFSFKVELNDLTTDTILSPMPVPRSTPTSVGTASWKITLKNANALNAAKTSKLLIKEFKIGDTPLTGGMSLPGGTEMLGLEATAADAEVPFVTEVARLDVTVPLSVTVCVAKDGTMAQPSPEKMYVENRSSFPVKTTVNPSLTRLAADTSDSMRQVDAPALGIGTDYDLAIRPLLFPGTESIPFKTSNTTAVESRALVVSYRDFAEIPSSGKCNFDFLSDKMPSGLGTDGAPANYSYRITFKASIAGTPNLEMAQ